MRPATAEPDRDPLEPAGSRQTFFHSGRRVNRYQTAGQATPANPIAAKVPRQPNADEMARIRAGATRAATLVPLVKMPLPKARSRGSRARATMRVEAGQLADSITP